MEDYKMRYEEALERARKLYNEAKANEYTSDMEDYEAIFPELKESEDERIRKAISIYLDWLDGRKDYAPRGEYSIRDMVVWLEKQGEKDKFIKELGEYKVKWRNKVMEAPEKIYLTKNLLGELRDDWDALPSENFISIEYTRTDAFIEKAAVWFANRYQANGSYLNAHDIEDFEKAMKE